MKSRIRGLLWLVVSGLLVAACGGGDGAGDGSGESTVPGSGSTGSTTATSAPPTDDTTGGTTSGLGGSGEGTMSYTFTGGVEASGEASLFPGMSFVDGGIWTIAFGDEDTLILINLDPSTPSINVTTSTGNLGGSSVECDFQIDRQDDNGAAGSIECSDVPGTGAGGSLLEGSDISATFDANP